MLLRKGKDRALSLAPHDDIAHAVPDHLSMKNSRVNSSEDDFEFGKPFADCPGDARCAGDFGRCCGQTGEINIGTDPREDIGNVQVEGRGIDNIGLMAFLFQHR